MASVGAKIFIRSALAFGSFAAIFSTHMLEASCVTQLNLALQLRQEAVEKVEKNEADGHTKVWLAYVNDSTFEGSMAALQHFGHLIMDAEGEGTPLFLRMLGRPLGVKAFSSLTGEDVAHYLKSYGEKDAAGFVLSALIEKLFYFEEHEAVIPSQKVFEQKSQQVAEFSARMEYLKNIQLDLKNLGDARLDQALRQYFYYFAEEGRFDPVSLSMSLSSMRLKDIWGKTNNEPEILEQPLINLHTIIYDYKDPSPPSVTRYRPLDFFWDLYITRRRKNHFNYYERELRVLMAAIPKAANDMKAYYIMDFFKGLDAFHTQFLIRATAEQKHLFLVNMQHHFPSFLKTISREKDEVLIDGDFVSPQTFDRIRRWCFRFELEEPTYYMGTQQEDPRS